MNKKPNYYEIALNWELWQKYVPGEAMDFDTWQVMDPDARIDLIEKLFGPELEPVQTLDVSAMTDFLGKTVYSVSLIEDGRIVNQTYARSWEGVADFAKTMGVQGLLDTSKRES